ncbi:MAG: hypothetical protein HY013_07075 [Candidatus Solibacter usitatus]|nr:hypothetical protein [Candidatus Solibacter usitatus]
MTTFLLGAISAAALAAGLFFLRFWKDTRDRLFLLFALAFGCEALGRTLLAVASLGENALVPYLIRFIAYALILAGIVDKNRGARGSG